MEQNDSTPALQQEITDGSAYYKLFKFFNDEHNLILTDGEIQDIIDAVNQFQHEKQNESIYPMAEYRTWLRETFPYQNIDNEEYEKRKRDNYEIEGRDDDDPRWMGLNNG